MFDIGLLVGRRAKDSQIFPGTRQSVGVAGGALDFGAAFSVSRHWYIRPVCRIFLLSSNEAGVLGAASIGYRF